MRKPFFPLWCAVCLLAVFALGPLGGSAAAKADVQYIEMGFSAMFSDGDIVWEYPYDDAFFLGDADEYSHALAQASLGLAFASARNSRDSADASVRAYLSEAGFGTLESEDYDVQTGRETIACMIGHKTLPDGETLVAVGVCGIGYGNEWLGNLDIGSGVDHQGFSAAAEKMAGRISAYMQKHGLSSRSKLWISGYSRAAAVANLASAYLMERGVFDQKRAFVYTFASPRTTRKPVVYPNVFNIVGKFDPATKLPYAEWGYGRHGVDLYTPAQETDSDYRQKLVPFNRVYEQLNSRGYHNSTEINHNFTIIAEYLVTIIPNAEYYDQHMHVHVEEVWNNPDLTTLRALTDALSTPVELSTLSDMEHRQHVEDLIDYLYGIFYGLAAGSVFDRDEMLVKASQSLLLEHRPEVYIAWLFSSDDPSQIYSDKLDYVHLILEGDADVSLFDQKGGFILNVAPDGSWSEETDVQRFLKRIRPVEDRPLIAVSGTEQRMVVLPKDQGMPFVIGARSEDAFAYYGILFNAERCMPGASSVRIINMEEGEGYLAFSFTQDGMRRMNAEDSIWGDADITAEIAEESELLSVSVTMQMEGFEEVTFDLRRVIIIAAVVLLVVLLLLLVILVLVLRFLFRVLRRIYRKIRHTSR